MLTSVCYHILRPLLHPLVLTVIMTNPIDIDINCLNKYEQTVLTMAELVVDVNSRDKKTHWAFTLEHDLEKVKTTSTDGVRITLQGVLCIIYIGPIEDSDETIDHPHRHCMLSYKGPERSCRKGKARACIQEYIKSEYNQYLRGIVSSPARYIQYAWKTVDPAKSVIEKTIKRAIQEVSDAGMAVTSKRVRTHLTTTAGAVFTQRNKLTTDLMLQEMDIYLPSAEVSFVVDPIENKKKAFRTLLIMNRIITNAVLEHSYICTHSDVVGTTPQEIINLVMALITLPYFCARWRGGDGLPGLMLWGDACTGKSHLFKHAPVYSKIPQDAQGVSRFKQSGVQRAFLLDDIKASFLTDHTNMGTLRQLLLGDSTTIKVMGDIQDVKGWVVATSNEEPIYLSQTPPEGDTSNWQMNCNAWKRRFITIKLTSPVDIDPIIVNWHHDSARMAAIAVFLSVVDQTPTKSTERLVVYKDHILTQVEDGWKTPFIDMINKEADWLDNVLPEWTPPNAFDVMMKKLSQ